MRMNAYYDRVYGPHVDRRVRFGYAVYVALAVNRSVHWIAIAAYSPSTLYNYSCWISKDYATKLISHNILCARDEWDSINAFQRYAHQGSAAPRRHPHFYRNPVNRACSCVHVVHEVHSTDRIHIASSGHKKHAIPKQTG